MLVSFSILKDMSTVMLLRGKDETRSVDCNARMRPYVNVILYTAATNVAVYCAQSITGRARSSK